MRLVLMYYRGLSFMQESLFIHMVGDQWRKSTGLETDPDKIICWETQDQPESQ